MTTAPSVDIGTLISKTPEVLGGAPCISGTRMPVRSIAQMHNSGLSPEEMREEFDSLQLAQIYAAIAYYHANKKEIDDDLAADERLGSELAAAFPKGAGKDDLPRLQGILKAHSTRRGEDEAAASTRRPE
jgi:uncharacterized protein (DUF433 family)